MEREEIVDMDRHIEAVFEEMVEILNEMVLDLDKTIARMEEIRNRKNGKLHECGGI